MPGSSSTTASNEQPKLIDMCERVRSAHVKLYPGLDSTQVITLPEAQEEPNLTTVDQVKSVNAQLRSLVPVLSYNTLLAIGSTEPLSYREASSQMPGEASALSNECIETVQFKILNIDDVEKAFQGAEVAREGGAASAVDFHQTTSKALFESLREFQTLLGTAEDVAGLEAVLRKSCSAAQALRIASCVRLLFPKAPATLSTSPTQTQQD